MIWDAKTWGLIPMKLHIETACPIGTKDHTALDFMANFEFLDGTPCGILEGVTK